jgi:hypothetical protein
MHFLTATSSTFHLLKPLPLTGNDQQEQSPNHLIVEMDGFEKNNGVIIRTALKRSEILDTDLMIKAVLFRFLMAGKKSGALRGLSGLWRRLFLAVLYSVLVSNGLASWLASSTQ